MLNYNYGEGGISANITAEERFLSTVAILRYDIKRDRKSHFNKLYQTYLQQLHECKRLGLDIDTNKYVDIESFHEATFTQATPQRFSPTL